MALASDNPYPSVLIRESATDGSDFSNPAADYRRLFLGEDGQLHVKDSAGAVTDIGSGSGAVATDAIFDAKGDLPAGTGANTAAKLTVGANGTILTAASGETTGLLWSAAPTSGKVTRTAGDLTYTSTTFADVTGMSVTLTTQARRCLVVVTAEGIHSASTFSLALDIDIDGARLGNGTWGLVRGQAHANGRHFSLTFSFITDVLSAASHTFKLQAATDGATATLSATTSQPLVFAVHELA